MCIGEVAAAAAIVHTAIIIIAWMTAMKGICWCELHVHRAIFCDSVWINWIHVARFVLTIYDILPWTNLHNMRNYYDFYIRWIYTSSEKNQLIGLIGKPTKKCILCNQDEKCYWLGVELAQFMDKQHCT